MALLESFRDIIEPFDPLHIEQIGPLSINTVGYLIADAIKALLESFRDIIEPFDPLHTYRADRTSLHQYCWVRNSATAFNLTQASVTLSQTPSRLLESFRDIIEPFHPLLIEQIGPLAINTAGDIIEPFHPLLIEQIGPLAINTAGIRIFAQIQNFDLTGLKWYVVEHVTFSTLRLAFSSKVTIPWITATGRYNAEARIGFIGHTAGGNYRFFLNRLETSVDVRVGTNIFGGGSLVLRELAIDLNIHDVNVQVTGMVGSSVLNNLINSLVQNAAQSLLVDQMQDISAMLSRELFDTVNEFLSRFSLQDILG
ncbi:hypothetical protein NE865_16077 [Phthorimaea operculella]|nr:hypothetical protein NE865_16077 [Phthorimaea operculella]